VSVAFIEFTGGGPWDGQIIAAEHPEYEYRIPRPSRFPGFVGVCDADDVDVTTFGRCDAYRRDGRRAHMVGGATVWSYSWEPM